MDKKKILMVHNFYQIGGGEHTVFKNEVEMLCDNGHDVIEYTRCNDELKNSKLKFLLLPFTTVWSLKTYREVKKIIKEENIEIVHCHNTFPLISPSVYYAAISEKVPVVQTIHNFRFLCPCGVFYRDGHVCEECLKKKSFKPAVQHKCYRNSKIQTLVVSTMLNIHRKLGTYNKINYIFLTEFNRKKFAQLININEDNVFIKPNFVKEFMMYHSQGEMQKKFIFASRLDENKGVKYLLDQWENMSKEFQLHIYGSGPLEKYVKEKVRNISNVSYFGFCSHEEIFDDMKNAMALIFPSLWYEGYPMIIAESMSIGCPVVSANIGNAADIVSVSSGGVTFDFDIEKSFENAVMECVLNRKELSINAYQYYKEVMTKERNYERLRIIYDKARVI